MIAMLFLAAVQAANMPPGSTPTSRPGQPSAPLLGAIGKQTLPTKGCAAYLWSARDRQLVAMAVAEPATIRLNIDGRMIDLMRVGEGGTGPLGFDQSTRYTRDDLAVTLDMTVTPRENLTAGAQVPDGTLTVQRQGRDALIEPVGGLVGCAS